MAHFAEIDDNNVVIRVTVVNNDILKDENSVEQESLGLEYLTHLGGRWVQTSYNNTFRKNYAGIGYTYDTQRNAFIPPQPFPSWILNEETCNWNSPVPQPEFDPENPIYYIWNEEILNWEEISE